MCHDIGSACYESFGYNSINLFRTVERSSKSLSDSLRTSVIILLSRLGLLMAGSKNSAGDKSK